jgi:LemA protein
MPIEWVLPAVAVLLVIWGTITRSRLVALQQAAVQAWAEVDDLLRRRQELVPRLVEAVRGRVKRERKTLDGVIAARGRAATEETPASIAKAEEALTTAIAKVFEVVEENPDLAADPGLLHLKSDFSTIESRILRSARQFNETAREYNDARLGFPGAFLAYVIRFDVLQYYVAGHAVPRTQRPDPSDRDRDAGVTML